MERRRYLSCLVSVYGVNMHSGVRCCPVAEGGMRFEILLMAVRGRRDGDSAEGLRAVQAARRRTSQMVTAMSRTDSASSQPPSIHWKGQNRLPGW